MTGHEYGLIPSNRKDTLAIFARCMGGSDGGARRNRTGGPVPATEPSPHAGSVARRARRSHPPQSLHHQPGRDRQADDQPRHLAAAGQRPSRSTSTPSSTCAATTTWSSARPRTARAEAHHLDAEPAHGQHVAVKMRLEPTRKTPEPRVHPGHDWFFVIEGRVRCRSANARSPSRPARPPSSPP